MREFGCNVAAQDIDSEIVVGKCKYFSSFVPESTRRVEAGSLRSMGCAVESGVEGIALLTASYIKDGGWYIHRPNAKPTASFQRN